MNIQSLAFLLCITAGLLACHSGNSETAHEPPERSTLQVDTVPHLDSMKLDWAAVTRVLNMQQDLQMENLAGNSTKITYSAGILAPTDSLSYILRNDSVQIAFNWHKDESRSIYHAFLLDKGQLIWARKREWINDPDSSYANELQYYLVGDTIDFVTEKKLPLLYREMPTKLGNLPLSIKKGNRKALRAELEEIWQPVRESIAANHSKR